MATRAAERRAELAGSSGAGVLGAGLGALLAQWLGGYALALVAVGVVLHGWGMLEKHRLQAGAEVPRWSNALYWLCWFLLAVLTVWIGLKALRG
jgi:hypothetical protein